MSTLLADWLKLARSWGCGAPGDRYYAIEEQDPRISFERRVASGGLVDARPEKAGVILLVLTDDGGVQELGVSSREQARNILTCLRDAWPDITQDELTAAARAGRATGVSQAADVVRRTAQFGRDRLVVEGAAPADRLAIDLLALASSIEELARS